MYDLATKQISPDLVRLVATFVQCCMIAFALGFAQQHLSKDSVVIFVSWFWTREPNMCMQQTDEKSLQTQATALHPPARQTSDGQR